MEFVCDGNCLKEVAELVGLFVSEVLFLPIRQSLHFCYWMPDGYLELIFIVLFSGFRLKVLRSGQVTRSMQPLFNIRMVFMQTALFAYFNIPHLVFFKTTNLLTSYGTND